MDRDRLKDLFAEALELPLEARAAFVMRSCDDPADRRELLSLLEAFGAVSGFLEAPPRVSPELPERVGPYRILGVLGEGGMGVVYRAWDEELGRSLALKTLRPEALSHPGMVERFRRESALCAQLQHPGIVPVHARGEAGGLPWFTMREVGGATLTDRIREAVSLDGPTLRRLLGYLVRACEAVGYAHHSGVVHRDLKPDNLMVGDFGEVLVLDWGLARSVREDRPETPGPALPEALRTRVGQVAGTPSYMAPEQARGEPDLDVRVDVHALGAVLHTILTGSPPFAGLPVSEVLARVSRGEPAPEAPRPGAPEELVTLAREAMASHPHDRPADAGALAEVLSGWLAGAQRRARALALVAEAEALVPRITAEREAARARRAEAAALGAGVGPSAPVERKAPVWEREDAAAARERSAELLEIERDRLLGAALTQEPGLTEAHEALADRYRALHEAAEATRAPAALRYEAMLRIHDRGTHARWLAGRGAVSLFTEPPGAEVRVLRFEERGRRQVPVDTGLRARTPLVELELPHGSYLLALRAEGREPVDLPVLIERDRHLDGVRPGEAAPTPILLPVLGALGPDDRYVPAGWAILGEPTARHGLPRRRIWVDGFVIRRLPVTNREMIAFLDAVDEPERFVPRETTGGHEEGPPVYGRDGRRFVLVPDAQGDTWDPDWPVVQVNWTAACAWCAWEADRTRRGWRLPWELEREKAGRGVDGRDYPWGDHPEPTWSHNAQGQLGRPMPARAGEPPDDVSVYGVQGTAGNTRDWCLDVKSEEGPSLTREGLWMPPPVALEGEGAWRLSRGGAWNANVDQGRAGHRLSAPEGFRYALGGFRAARDLDDRDRGR